MAKLLTFPTLYNDVLQISMSKLKEWQYLTPNQIKNGTLTWSRNGNTTGSISINVNTNELSSYIELDYKYKEEPRTYKVELIKKPSNLGIGFIWYFVCPETNKLCRKLYSIGGYFLHREAFKGCMYESQIQSKKYREIDKSYGAYFRLDKLYEEKYKKYFKKTYAGKPTKRFLRLMEEIRKAESVSHEEIMRLMIS